VTDKKILRLYIKDYLFANSEELYNRALYKKFRNLPQVKTTKLYSIIRTEGIKFNFESFSIDNNYDITIEILKRNKSYSITFNLMQVYYNEFGEEYSSLKEFKDELENILLTQVDFGKDVQLSKDILHFQISPYQEQESDKNLILVCPFYFILSKGTTAGISLNIYRILNMFNINLINDLEIIYIGKSMKDTMKRLKNHNKWGEVLAIDKESKKEVYDYIVYNTPRKSNNFL